MTSSKRSLSDSNQGEENAGWKRNRMDSIPDAMMMDIPIPGAQPAPAGMQLPDQEFLAPVQQAQVAGQNANEVVNATHESQDVDMDIDGPGHASGDKSQDDDAVHGLGRAPYHPDLINDTVPGTMNFSSSTSNTMVQQSFPIMQHGHANPGQGTVPHGLSHGSPVPGHQNIAIHHAYHGLPVPNFQGPSAYPAALNAQMLPQPFIGQYVQVYGGSQAIPAGALNGYPAGYQGQMTHVAAPNYRAQQKFGNGQRSQVIRHRNILPRPPAQLPYAMTVAPTNMMQQQHLINLPNFHGRCASPTVPANMMQQQLGNVSGVHGHCASPAVPVTKMQQQLGNVPGVDSHPTQPATSNGADTRLPYFGPQNQSGDPMDLVTGVQTQEQQQQQDAELSGSNGTQGPPGNANGSQVQQQQEDSVPDAADESQVLPDEDIQDLQIDINFVPDNRFVCSTRSGKDATEFDNSLEYLADVKELPDFFHHLLDILAPFVKFHVGKLVAFKAKRNLEFKLSASRRDAEFFHSDRWVEAVTSMLTYVTGNVQPVGVKCKVAKISIPNNRTVNNKLFPVCITPPEVANLTDLAGMTHPHACANCQIDKEGSRCSFHLVAAKAYKVLQAEMESEKARAEAQQAGDEGQKAQAGGKQARGEEYDEDYEDQEDPEDQEEQAEQKAPKAQKGGKKVKGGRRNAKKSEKPLEDLVIRMNREKASWKKDSRKDLPAGWDQDADIKDANGNGVDGIVDGGNGIDSNGTDVQTDGDHGTGGNGTDGNGTDGNGTGGNGTGGNGTGGNDESLFVEGGQAM